MRFSFLLITLLCLSLTPDSNLIAQDHLNVELVGRIYNLWDRAWNVEVVEDLAFVATVLSGLQIVDISDPENPEIIGYRDYINNATGVAVSRNYAYVTDYESGLYIISVADPENPEEVGYYNTPGAALGVALSEDGLIYVADQTNVGIYRFTHPDAIDDNQITLIPDAFNLSPAYPNPFNAFTRLTYSLPEPTWVSIRVYDTAGRLAAKVLEARQPAGRYNAVWDGGEAHSGVYFVRMQSGDFDAVSKVVLVK